MENVKVAIVEDEFIIAHDISAHLQEIGYEVTDIYDSGTAALAGIKTNPPDIALLDINIKGGIDGIETGEIIRHNSDIPIIYITAYSDEETIARAKKTRPHAFIVKPFNFKNLSTTIEFAVYNYSNKIEADIETANHLPSVEEKSHVSENSIFIKEKGRLIKVKASDLCYLAAKGSYCEIITSNRKFTISRNLQSILERLEKNSFIRVHRSYAVNIERIDAINEMELIIGKDKIPITKAARTELTSRIKSI